MIGKALLKWLFAMGWVLFLSAGSPALGETWRGSYIKNLPDTAFAAIETTDSGTKVRHLPHHNHVGEVDIPHLKSALGRIHQVKWVDPANFEKAMAHLKEHCRAYKQQRSAARGLNAPVNVNKAQVSELLGLPYIGEGYAKAIIEYRKAHGGFKTVSELAAVPGINAEILCEIEDLVTVE
jgi:competence protein ComEA